MKPAREWVTLTGRTPIQTATVPTSSQKWQPSKITILMPFKFVFLADRSWEQGEMGGRYLLDQLGAQLVHHLPVWWGCCWVLHPWHVPGGEDEKKSELELEEKNSGEHVRPWVHPRVRFGKAGRSGATFPQGPDEHEHQVQHHEQDVGDEAPAQSKLCSAHWPKSQGGKCLSDWKVFKVHLPPFSDRVIFPRYKWLVFNPECNTINKEISLTLSRSHPCPPLEEKAFPI